MPLPPRCTDLLIRLTCLGLGGVLTACGPATRLADPPTPPRATTSTVPAPSPSEVPASDGLDVIAAIRNGGRALARDDIDAILKSPTRPTVPLQTHRLRAGGTTLTVLTFDRSTHHLAVVDNERGPGTGATTSRAAAKAAHAIAAINAGFFTPRGAPLGLVIENGKKFGTLNSSSLGAGFYVHDTEARATCLADRTARARFATPQDLLQSGPFLIEKAKPVSGLSDSRPRPRSFLLWDGDQGWGVGHAGSATLADLAATLASQPVPGLTIKSALNLDGGTSSDLWIASSVKGGPASTRHFWNKPVRNYLVLIRR